VTCYEKMTAQELHDLVTRLEAHGFKVPEDLALSLNHWWYRLPMCPASAAAAIIEVAARDWWLGKNDRHLVGSDHDGAWARNAVGDSFEGPTPLHAIVAAVEAKEGK